MKRAILSANLGSFDKPVEPVAQNVDFTYHCFTDKDFPPITGLTPRFQYRIPKLFGWQMFPGYDIYLWLDASMSLTREDSLQWFLNKLGDADMALFKHPWRNSIKEESDHIEEYLSKEDKYLTPRYKNGLHKEQLADIQKDKDYVDDKLFASTAFIYRDSEDVRDVLRMWWLHQSRYYTCDQLALPYVARGVTVNTIEDNLFKSKFITLVSKH